MRQPPRAPRTSACRRAALCALLLLVMGPATAAAATDPAARIEGHGTWTGPEGPVAANATWLLVDGALAAFTVRSGNDTWHCHATPGAPCGGEATPENATLHRQDGGTRWNGTFEAQASETLVAATPPPSMLAGTIVTALAAVLLLTTIGLALAWLHERRVAGFLARRLYEETKGRMPSDWPERLRQQWIARVLIRGKN